jgi:two-component system, sporulation sensor kinase B
MVIVRRYLYLSTFKKILALSVISIISKTISKFPLVIISDNVDFQFLSAFKFYVVQSVILGLAIYVIESIRKNVQMRKDIIESEKMKVISVISFSCT